MRICARLLVFFLQGIPMGYCWVGREEEGWGWGWGDERGEALMVVVNCFFFSFSDVEDDVCMYK